MRSSISDIHSAAAYCHRSAGCNIASYLPRMSRGSPDRPAIIITRSGDRRGRADYATMSFAELDTAVNRCANGLRQAGIERNMRVLLMVRPGFAFIELVFALFKMGAVPVMLDPGMGLGRMLECIRQVDPQAMIGVSAAQTLRILKPDRFKSVERVVTVGRRWFWGGPTLEELTRGACPTFDIADTRPDDVAAILFTSGATGPAKGAVYEHAMFDAQVRAIQGHYGIEPGEIDLPTFPLFALFGPAMGMTSVIPDMDPSKPARVNPARIVEAVHDHKVTTTFGSPALWRRVGEYCAERAIKLPTLRRILIAGAPVPESVIETLHGVLAPGADVHTPYGATEALPVCSIAGQELRAECSRLSRRGAGICVGRPMPGIDMRIIRITDAPLTSWSDDLLVPDGELGEIVVGGSVVTKGYFGLPRADALAKMHDGERILHRMGDVGYRDAQGRVWLCGRKGHRVSTKAGTLFTIRCEAIFNEHPDVARSALVGVGPAGDKQAVVVVEPVAGKYPNRLRSRQALREQLLSLARVNELTRGIQNVVFRRSLPVDIRHNAKINREELALWAARQVS
ncbi:MAG: fatty acid CoA ligase family protein [Phycisphaerae bacterium]